MLNVKRNDMTCKDCIWDKTRVYVSPDIFYCKGVDDTTYDIGEIGFCPCFQHRDYPKKIEL